MSEAQGFVKDVLLNGRSLDRSYRNPRGTHEGRRTKVHLQQRKGRGWSHRALLPPYSETAAE